MTIAELCNAIVTFGYKQTSEEYETEIAVYVFIPTMIKLALDSHQIM